MAEEARMNIAYLMLKAAHKLYGKGPSALQPSELERVKQMAIRQFDLESRVLATDEARGVIVPQATLDAALAEIRGRYESEEELEDDLAVNGLSISMFSAALERELKVEGVLEKVGSRAARVSDIDIELYYHYHPEQFQRPETRIARHILVTINEELPENTREAARRRIDAVAARLVKEPARFEEQAMKHSECPTALQGGLLGEVKHGVLYAELETVLFGLDPMQLSGVVESPLGLHLLRCDRIIPAGMLSLGQVRDSIRELLVGRRKRICQNAWLKQIQHPVLLPNTSQETKAA
jgi:peptidyl-prolyl cis-trans isomerase C